VERLEVLITDYLVYVLIHVTYLEKNVSVSIHPWLCVLIVVKDYLACDIMPILRSQIFDHDP
jgi:hypothetical protein